MINHESHQQLSRACGTYDPSLGTRPFPRPEEIIGLRDAKHINWKMQYVDVEFEIAIL